MCFPFVIKNGSRQTNLTTCWWQRRKATHLPRILFSDTCENPVYISACASYWASPTICQSTYCSALRTLKSWPGTLHPFIQQVFLGHLLWISLSDGCWGNRVKWSPSSRVRRTKSPYSWSKYMAPVLELGHRLGPLVIIGLQEPETRRLKSFLNQL